MRSVMSGSVLLEKRQSVIGVHITTTLRVRHMQSPDSHRALTMFKVLNLTAFGQK